MGYFTLKAKHKKTNKVYNVALIDFEDGYCALRDPENLIKQVLLKGRVKNRKSYIQAHLGDLDFMIDSGALI